MRPIPETATAAERGRAYARHVWDTMKANPFYTMYGANWLLPEFAGKRELTYAPLFAAKPHIAIPWYMLERLVGGIGGRKQEQGELTAEDQRALADLLRQTDQTSGPLFGGGYPSDIESEEARQYLRALSELGIH